MMGPDAAMMGPDEGLMGPDEGLMGPDEGLMGPDEGLMGPDEGLAGLTPSPMRPGRSRPDRRMGVGARGRRVASRWKRRWRPR